MQQSVNHSPTTDIVETALREAAAMLHNLATRYDQDFEELYQEAAIILLERLQKMPQGIQNIRAYLHSAIRLNSLDHISSHYRMRDAVRTTSLDEPLTEDNDGTLADMLAAPPDLADQNMTEADQKTAALYASLRCSSKGRRRYIREIFDLNAYQPVIYDYKTREKDRARAAIRQAAYRHLRNDAQLASEVLS
jgi:hypothetical protein